MSRRVKIRLEPGWSVAIDGEIIAAGQVAEVDADRGAALVERGIAVEVREKIKAASRSPRPTEAGG